MVVNPIPNAVATPVSQTACSGSAITTIALTGNVTGTVFNWTRDNTVTVTGIANTGAGNISGTLTNTTAVPVTVTFTITPSYTNAGATCTGTPITATILVNPTPTVGAVANQVVCNGSPTTAVNFTTTVPGTVFNWTNSNNQIGLPLSGTGNILSFNGINTTNVPIISTITVTPVFTGGGVSCTGTPQSFTITVNPTPTVDPVTAVVACNNATAGPINFTGFVAGTVYSWTNSNTAIGLGASGTGNIGAFTATNPGTAPISATITVTPGYTNGGVTCTGTASTFTITVNPSTVITTQPLAQTLCFGNNATFTVAATGLNLSYQWQVNTGSGYNDITGATGTTLTLTAPIVATSGYLYRCVVTGTCGTVNSNGVLLRVNALPNIDLGRVPARLCLSDRPVILLATPAGGTWTATGAGLTGNVFSAAAAGVGIWTIGYTVTDGNGCTNSANTLIVVNDCIERHNNFAHAVRLYPNPNNGQFKLKLSSDLYTTFSARIIDVLGQVVKPDFTFTNQGWGSEVSFDFRDLPAGTYILEVYNQNEKASFEFVIQH